MPRGDGGRPMFENDPDRFGWLDLLERACEGFGLRVHAWVPIGNRFPMMSQRSPRPAIERLRYF